MKNSKDELQHIILGDEPAGQESQLKKVQCFFRSNAETSFAAKKQQQFKSEETAALIAFPARPSLSFERTGKIRKLPLPVSSKLIYL